MTIIEYVEPPVPEIPEGPVIEIPEEEGTPVTIFTHDNGMTSYLHRARHDWHAADQYAEKIQNWLMRTHEEFIGLPSSQHPTECTWFTRHTIRNGFHLHDAVSPSPIAVRKAGRQRQIVVPMGDGVVQIPQHGPGKRGK